MPFIIIVSALLFVYFLRLNFKAIVSYADERKYFFSKGENTPNKFWHNVVPAILFLVALLFGGKIAILNILAVAMLAGCFLGILIGWLKNSFFDFFY